MVGPALWALVRDLDDDAARAGVRVARAWLVAQLRSEVTILSGQLSLLLQQSHECRMLPITHAQQNVS